MDLPNFFIIGAGKAGTTSLYEYLCQHPQVFMSAVKEPRFFALEGEPPFRGPAAAEIAARSIWTFEAYQSLFRQANGKAAVGEASPMYLYSHVAAGRIHQRVPQARLIAILRDPAERAFSDYLMNVAAGWETLGFADALRQEGQRWHERWAWGHYTRQGFYHEHLSRFYALFPHDRVRVYLFEDFTRDPASVCRDAYEFLEVDPAFQADCSARYQATGVVRHRWLRRLLNSPHPFKSALKPWVPRRFRHAYVRLQAWNLARPTIPDDCRQALCALFRQDTLRLQDLIGRDLSRWLAC
jgi:hypothetical protein